MTRAALEKNRITIAALLLVLLGGVISYFSLPQDEDPGFIIRTAVVITYFPGASPERVENLITDKIEEVVQQIPELDFIASQSRTGVSIVNVNIQQSFKDMRPIWDNLRRKVESKRGDLPEGAIGPIVDDEFGDVFGIVVGLTAEGYTYAEMKDIADAARDELLRIPDAAKVEIFGAQEERIFVEYNDARLAELGLSVNQLQQILSSANIVNPGGNIQVGPERITLEPTGNFEDLEDVRRTVIELPGRSQLVYLEDVARVSRGYVDPPERLMHVSGEQGLGIGVSMRKGGNILTLGSDVRTVMTRLQGIYPIGVEFAEVANQPTRVDKKVKEFVSNLLQAILIVLIVMLLSLGVRTGLVVASLIPAAMLMSLLIMSIRGIGLDQMSLAALIIALGMLIDNAIVMSESVMVRMEEGMPAFDAAVASGNELRIPLLTSSLTTAAAFLPMYLAKSNTGEYVGVLFLVVTITLLCSWILSLTMTPLLCVKFLKPPREEEGHRADVREPLLPDVPIGAAPRAQAAVRRARRCGGHAVPRHVGHGFRPGAVLPEGGPHDHRSRLQSAGGHRHQPDGRAHRGGRGVHSRRARGGPGSRARDSQLVVVHWGRAAAVDSEHEPAAAPVVVRVHADQRHALRGGLPDDRQARGILRRALPGSRRVDLPVRYGSAGREAGADPLLGPGCRSADGHRQRSARGASQHQRYSQHRRQLGAAHEEVRRRDRPVPRAARRRDEPRHRCITAVHAERYRIHGVP